METASKTLFFVLLLLFSPSVSSEESDENGWFASGVEYAKQTMESHPTATAVAAGAAVGVGVVLTAPVAIGAAGFTSAGVAVNSAAAAWMTTFGGNVVAGSVFATLQSIGAAGALSTAASTAILGVTSLTGALIGSSSSKDGLQEESPEEQQQVLVR
eukprot:TRINITY_DN7698_c0_g2_i1.p1 TRINITY_DN7698_c0_g2~~TRINITY_DN7698_c0_g2_i1.p1  ORF type:complete len:157 (-),score=30.62 TRINITY_DN7698_c0_g2_i1:78-548(-)